MLCDLQLIVSSSKKVVEIISLASSPNRNDQILAGLLRHRSATRLG